MTKSTVEQIKGRFDQDVERFSDAQSGQLTQMDSALVLDMMMPMLAAANPAARRMLDIGCGAGNFDIRALGVLPGLECSLIDLSAPMLERAEQRIKHAGGSVGRIWQGDVRTIQLPPGQFDLIIAASVLHHLRSRQEWHEVLAAIHAALKPGGSFWYWDLVAFEHPAVTQVQNDRYAAYLTELGGSDFTQKVFAYIEEEDSPESVSFILGALRQAGFTQTDIIHQDGPFAALMASKAGAASGGGNV